MVPRGIPGERRPTGGATRIADISGNSDRLISDLPMHGVKVDDPFLKSDRFAVRFSFDETHVPTDVRGTAKTMSLYTVEDHMIDREEVSYFAPPPGPPTAVSII